MGHIAIDVIAVSSENDLDIFCTDFRIKYARVDFGDIFAFQDLAQCVKVYDVIAFSGGDAERDLFVREMALKTYFESDSGQNSSESNKSNIKGKSKYMVPESISQRIQWVDIYKDALQRCKDVVALLAPSGHPLCGQVLFYDKDTENFTMNPSSALLREGFELQSGRNRMRAVLRAMPEILLDFEIYLYKSTDKLVVFDIDGTVTKSDTRGYLETVFLGKYTYIHEGLVPFVHTAAQALGPIMFLSSRPLTHQPQTRRLLKSIRDPKARDAAHETTSVLPEGPLFLNQESLSSAAYRELISQKTMEFKLGVLERINAVFQQARRSSGSGVGLPFAVGIGNKHSDMQAYYRAGIPIGRVFLVDQNSVIKLWDVQPTESKTRLGGPTWRSSSHDGVQWKSYDDSELLNYIIRLGEQMGSNP